MASSSTGAVSLRSLITSEFEPLFEELEAERRLADVLRDKAHELDRLSRQLSAILADLYSSEAREFSATVQQTAAVWVEVRSKIDQLACVLPEDGLYRWCDEYSFAFKNLTSTIAQLVLLATGGLVTKQQASHVLGLDKHSRAKIQLVTDVYLHALINAINQLPRLALNSVTLGDYSTPLRLAEFVKQVHSGFQLLNLKNDSLRKRFDSLKVSSTPPIRITVTHHRFKRQAFNATSVDLLHAPIAWISDHRPWPISQTVRRQKHRRNRLRHLVAWPRRSSRPRH